MGAILGVTEDDIGDARQADLVFSAYSLDAPLSDRDDPGELADLLGEDDKAVEHAVDMKRSTPIWRNCPNASGGFSPCGSGTTSPRPRSAIAWASPRCTYRGCSATR
jgi:hypothetical protein